MVQTFEWDYVSQSISEVINLFREESSLKNIKIEFHNLILEEQCALVDSQKLLVCLVNLLSNSIKFSKKEGSINIQLRQTQHINDVPKYYSLSKKEAYFTLCQKSFLKNEFEFNQNKKQSINLQQRNSMKIKGEQVKSLFQLQSFDSTIKQKANLQKFEIIIKDTGIGIDGFTLQTLQSIVSGSDHNDEVVSLKDKSQGFMMGIRVVAQLLNYLNEQTGQWMKIKSSKDQGTQITINLILQTSPQEHISRRVNQEGTIKLAQQSKQLGYDKQIYLSQHQINSQADEIMIVDDETYNLMVLEQLFKFYGQKIIKCDTGKQALDLIRKRGEEAKQSKQGGRLVKAIFMDYQMPEMDGCEATKQIKNYCKINQFQQILIFGCTGFSAQEDIEQLLKAGMVKVYSKPITKKILEESLEIIHSHNENQNLENVIESESLANSVLRDQKLKEDEMKLI